MNSSLNFNLACYPRTKSLHVSPRNLQLSILYNTVMYWNIDDVKIKDFTCLSIWCLSYSFCAYVCGFDVLVEEVERNRISFEVKVLAVLLYFSGILLQELLAVRASFTRSSLDAEIFLNKVLGCCDNKPTFLVDKGPWYREAFERLGIEFRHET